MNDWKSDEALYASAFYPNKQASKEIESLREEVAKLTREILALKKETATSRKEKKRQQTKRNVIRNTPISSS